MSDNAIDSQGTVLALSDAASPPVYTTVPEVSNLNFEGGERAEVDVTDINSTTRAYKVGLRDAVRVTFDINYRPGQTQHDALRTAYNNGSTVTMRCTFTDDSPATTWTFTAYVTAFPVTVNIDESVKSSLALRIDDSGITEA